MTVTLNCLRGNAQLKLVGCHAFVLTGKRRRWDHLFFSWYTDDSFQIQGLWRGSYGDAVVSAAELIDGLERVGCTQSADHIREMLADREVKYCERVTAARGGGK